MLQDEQARAAFPFYNQSFPVNLRPEQSKNTPNPEQNLIKTWISY